MRSKHKPYPTYKPSGIEWLGEIPDAWSTVRADWVLDSIKNTISQGELAGKQVFHYSIPAIQETGTGAVEEGGSVDSSKTVLHGNELLVSKLNPRKSTVLVSEKKELLTICSTEFVVLVPRNIDMQFACYLYRSHLITERISSTVQSVTYSHQRANPADIHKIWIALPSYLEQRAIADFLDRETAKIDALIAKKQRLIELLQEKRTALISHAVTKGLDPSVPMKDSGIEWLGMIPKHWEVELTKRRFQVDLGKMLNSTQQGEDGEKKPYLRAANILWNDFDLSDINEMKFTPDQLKRYALRGGDLLVTEGGVTVGRSAIWREQFAECYYQNSINRVRPKNDLPVEYLYYWLYHLKLNGFIDLVSDKATFGHLTKEKLAGLPLLVPSTNEAVSIVEMLSRNEKKTMELKQKAELGIEHLKEYRSALISAAVTGKIDVRE